MPASIGINLRVTGHCRQGGRKYMEDFFSVAYQQTEDERDLEYAFFGIYDGHGGAEAAAFAKEHLMDTIVKHKSFWSENDDDVLKAIKDGYIATHYAMWKEQEKWPKTAAGLPSTAGTTASVAFIRRGKIYIGHVGDSGIILGYQTPGSNEWRARPLTKDHKPESAVEMTRIESCGGKVVSKSGVPRVVWNRPRIGHKGPVRRSTPIDEIPFLAVARSLGDLWSYNSQLDEFVVSPDPDCSVIPIDTHSFRCLIFGTDGLYNMLSAQAAVSIVQTVEKHNENIALSDSPTKGWLNPSKCLVERALERWSSTKMRADNTSVVTIMLDPPGPPRAQVLRNRKKSYAESGLQILTRYDNQGERTPLSPVGGSPALNTNPLTSSFSRYDPAMSPSYLSNIANTVDRLGLAPNLNNLHSRFTEIMQKTKSSSSSDLPSCSSFDANSNSLTPKEDGGLTELTKSNFFSQSSFEQFERQFIPKLRESTGFDPRNMEPTPVPSPSTNIPCNAEKPDLLTVPQPEPCSSTTDKSPSTNKDENIQINEISSSSSDTLETFEEMKNTLNEKKSYKSVSKTRRVMGYTIKHVLQPRTTVENSENIQLQSTSKESLKQPNESPKILVNQENTTIKCITRSQLVKTSLNQETKNLTRNIHLENTNVDSEQTTSRVLKPKNLSNNKKPAKEPLKKPTKNDNMKQADSKLNVENIARTTRSGNITMGRKQEKKPPSSSLLLDRSKRSSRASKLALILEEVKSKRTPKVVNTNLLDKNKVKRLQPQVILQRLTILPKKPQAINKKLSLRQKAKIARKPIEKKQLTKINKAVIPKKEVIKSSKVQKKMLAKIPKQISTRQTKTTQKETSPVKVTKRDIIKKVLQSKLKEAVVKTLEKKPKSKKISKVKKEKIISKKATMPLPTRRIHGPGIQVQKRPLRPKRRGDNRI